MQHECHTLDRHSIYECLILRVSSKPQLDLLDSFIVKHYERLKSHELQGTEPCIKSHSRVSQYWQAKL